MLLIVLLSLLAICSAERCQDEEPLPATLLLNKLGDFHMHGEFRTNFLSTNYVNFTITAQSYFRLLLDEIAIADVDVYLWRTGGSLVDYSVNYFESEMIAVLIDAGDYTIEFHTYSYEDGANFDYICQQIELEVAISPKALTTQRRSTLNFTGDSVFPTIDTTPLSEGRDLLYDTTSDPNRDQFNIQVRTVLNGSNNVISLYRYDFEIKLRPGASPVVQFEASLGFDFLTGGSFFLLLDQKNVNGTPQCDLVGARLGQYMDSRACRVGKTYAQNYNTIKATLTFGNYSLWIYDRLDKRFTDQAAVDRFPDPYSLMVHITQTDVAETLLSCDALPLPKSLNIPGLMDDTGYVNFRHQVLLNLSNTVEETVFTPMFPSLLRVWAEPHRIDVDFRLTTSSGNIIARSTEYSWSEESIMVSLDANQTYTLMMVYYGATSTVFCESILLELMLQPRTRAYSFDSCPAGNTDITPTDRALQADKDFIRTSNLAVHYWNTSSRSEILYTRTFTPPLDTLLKVKLESHFLNGLTLQFKSAAGQGFGARSEVVPSERNFYILRTFVYSNMTYTLTVKSLNHQAWFTSTSYEDFPRCAVYALEASFSDSNNIVKKCNYQPFPVTLSGPSYFASSNRVHINEIFRAEPENSNEMRRIARNISFSVRERSLLRAVTEEQLISNIDTDFYFYQNGNLVQFEAQDDREERLTRILEPGRNYVFQLVMYADYANLPSCVGINFEMEIAPIPAAQVGCTPLLPATNALRLDRSMPQDIVVAFSSEVHYSFRQTRSTAFELKIPIQVVDIEAVFVRVQLTYDFLWSDLNVRIQNDVTGELVAMGQNMFNKNEIFATSLFRGTYSLIISEPISVLDVELEHCADFSLYVAFAPSPAPSGTALSDESQCPYIKFPASWSSVAALSTLSNYSFHDQRTFRISAPDSRTDDVSFDVTEDSYIRIFVPQFYLLDVDVWLYRVNSAGGLEYVDHGAAIYGEENIFKLVRPARYLVRWRYYGFPYDTPCLAFPAELGIVTKQYMETAYPHVDACAGNPNQAFIDDSIVFSQEKRYNLVQSSMNFSLSKAFHVGRPVLLLAHIEFNFFVGHIYFRIHGRNVISPYLSRPDPERFYPSHIGDNRAFFNHLLYPGDYTIEMDNPSNSTITQCSEFTFTYLLDYNIPPTYCDEADNLPTDLFTVRGGSVPYGGLQNAVSGAIHISNSHFILPEVRGGTGMIMHDIEFKIKVPSYVRVWAKFDYNKHDIDFWFYRNASKTQFLDASAAVGETESHSMFLQPQTDPYLFVLVIYQYTRSACDHMAFEFLIETEASVINSKICPSPLPNPILPPSSIVLSPAQPKFELFGTEFAFTNAYIQQHSQISFNHAEIVYNISIYVNQVQNITLKALLGYDFIVSDFSLEFHTLNKVFRSTNNLLQTNTFVDFEAHLDVGEIATGFHYILLKERLVASTVRNFTSEHCERFTFMLSLLPPASTTDFQILSVFPPSGDALSTDSYLTIDLTFNHVVDFWIDYQNTGAFLLQSEFNTSNVLKPFYAIPVDKVVWLGFFLPANVFDSYLLKINASGVLDSNGASLAPYTQLHRYSTLDCNCGGHGSCIGGACVCDHPYVGTNCLACEYGFHKEALNCVRNTYCTSDSCNGHGVCSDSANYPVCACSKGYESTNTALCGKCAKGYGGYPNCTLKDDLKLLSCPQPVLPVSLEAIGYLGFDNTVHLQGDYLLESKYSHDTTFKVKETSFFRVYTEPHEVDIDLWLYGVNPVTGERRVVDYGINYAGEETLFQRLPPGEYVLTFNFITYGNTDAFQCESFNLELEIAPVIVFDDLVRRYSPCATSDILPQISFPTENIPTNFNYNPGTTFSVLQDNRPSFYNLSFTVPNTTQNGVLQLDLELGYRFLTGDLAVRLIRIGRISRTPTVEGTGFNKYNKHYLSHLLLPGDYVIQLYNPRPINASWSACSPFTFSLKTQMVPHTGRTRFNCQHPEFYSTYDYAFLYDSNNELTIFDDFYLTKSRYNVELTPAVVSNLRVRVNKLVGKVHTAQTAASIQLQAYINKDWVSVTDSSNGELYAEGLEINGYANITKYRLRYYFPDYVRGSSCQEINLQLQLSPQRILLQNNAQNYCPAGGVSQLPSFPVNYFTPALVPWTLPTSDYYSFSSFVPANGVILLWSFSTSDSIVLEANLGGDFLVDDLEIDLYGNDETVVRSHSLSLTHQVLVAKLPPGTYRFEIHSKANSTLLSSPQYRYCSRFTFDISVKHDTTELTCKVEGGLDIPTTLNNYYYLGFEKKLDVQSSRWLLPTEIIGGSYFETKDIEFTLTSNSLIRVFIEQHFIDIDIYVYEKLRNGTKVKIASSYNELADESFVTRVGGGNFVLQLLFYRYRASSEHCPTFNMQIAIHPESQLPPLITQCSSVFVTPSLFPELPSVFSVSSLNAAPYEKLATGHYQQINHATNVYPVTTYPLVFEAASSVHIEIGYNFLRSDLVLELKSNSGAEGSKWYGLNAGHINYIDVKVVPAGSYTLTIFEPVQNVDSHVHCAEFVLGVRVALIEPEQQLIVNEQFVRHFPRSLDTIEYLEFSNEMHIQDQFILLENPVGSTAAPNYFLASEFTLAVDSIVHVSLGRDDPFVIAMFAPGTLPPNRTSSNGHVLMNEHVQRLSRGDYILYFLLTDEIVSPGLTYATVQLQITPSLLLQSEINAFCSLSTPAWTAPAITPRPSDGYFHYSVLHARLDRSTIASNKTKMFSIDFALEKTSIIIAHIGFNFKIAHFTLQVKARGDNKADVNERGLELYNGHSLSALIPAGKYELNLAKTFAWPSNVDFDLPCTEFSFKISISSDSSGSQVSDCSSTDVLPWNLDTLDGGSRNLGGPLHGGELTMFSNKFLLNTHTTSLQTSFTLKKTSLITLFVSNYLWLDVSGQIMIKEGATWRTLVPFHSHKTYAQGVYFYLVENIKESSPDDPSQYFLLDIQYGDSFYEACPVMALGLFIQPRKDVEKRSVDACSTVTTKVYPPTTVDFVENRSIFVHTTSYFADSDFAITSNQPFKYSINISIDNYAYLDMSITASASSSLFLLRLYRVVNDQLTLFTEGTFEPSVNSELGEITNSLDLQLDYIYSRKYVVVIEQSNTFFAQSGLRYNYSVQHCYPYSFFMQLSARSVPTLRSVDPPEGANFNPTQNLAINLVFSLSLFDDQGYQVTRERNTALFQAFHLVSSKTSAKVYPIEVLVPAGNPIPDDLTRWRLVFPHSSLEYGVTYELNVLSGRLYSSTGVAFSIGQPRKYRMISFDNQCSGAGYMDPATKKCVCEAWAHRVGDHCELCERGFQFNDDGNCARPIGCTATTCSCSALSTSTHCDPIGNCSSNADVPGSVGVCVCPPNFEGAFCDSCAKGFTRYPACTASCTPECKHGRCDGANNKCICDGNWDGATCDVCASGYGGEGCALVTFAGIIRIVVLVLVAVLVLAIVVFALYILIKQIREWTGDEVNMDIMMDGLGAPDDPVINLSQSSSESEKLDGLGDDDL